MLALSQSADCKVHGPCYLLPDPYLGEWAESLGLHRVWSLTCLYWMRIPSYHPLIVRVRFAAVGLPAFLKGSLTGGKFTNSKAEMNYLPRLPVVLLSRRDSSCPLTNFGSEVKSNGSVFPEEVPRRPLSCLQDCLLRGRLVIQESNKSRLGDAEKSACVWSLGTHYGSLWKSFSLRQIMGPRGLSPKESKQTSSTLSHASQIQAKRLNYYYVY